MPKRIDNDDDVKQSIDSFADESRLSLPMGKSALYILSADYVDGYIHWVSLPDGRKMPVVCGGGVAGGGFAPNDCLLCKHVVDVYKKAKAEDDEFKSEKIRKRGNELRARYSAEMVVAIGELVKVKSKSGRKFEPDFEDAEVGRLPFTQKQYQDLINLRGSSKYPFIKSGTDLTNRVILATKAKEKDSTGKPAKYATVSFIPSKRTSPPPVEVDLDDDELSLEGLFEIDTKEIKKAYRLLTIGKKQSKVDDDDDDDDNLDFEDDGDDFDEDFEDDQTDSGEDEEDDTDSSEEDFEDDIPWEDEEDDEPVKKSTKKKRSTKTKPKSTGKRSRRKR